MNKNIGYLFIIGYFLIECTSAQSTLIIKEVDFTKEKAFWLSHMKGNKSIDFKSQFKFTIGNKSFFCTKANGLVYVFDLNEERVIENSNPLLNDGYTEPFQYYLDENIIAWPKRQGKQHSHDSIFTLKIYNHGNNTMKENIFLLPRGNGHSDPIVIDTNKILVDNLLFYSDKNSIDTLNVSERKKQVHADDHTFMRQNVYISDACYEATERCQKEFHGLSFTKILGNGKIVTADLLPKNISIPINTYRIEAVYADVLLMSSKIEPDKFLLYDMDTHFVYPVQLDNNVFNLNNLAVNNLDSNSHEGSNDEFAPNEVNFTFSCSMDNKNLYISLTPKTTNKVKTYKVFDYRSLMR
jgi:hypothetical protein